MTEANATPTAQVRHPGLVCRQCGCRYFLNAYTRPRHDSIVRGKHCRHCSRPITIREKTA